MAIVLDLPARDDPRQERGAAVAVVDEDVVRRHVGRPRASLEGPERRLQDEGFASVTVLRDPAEVDQVTIRR